MHPHVGGILPYIMGRIEEQTEVKRRGRDNITKSPREYYKQVYLDLVSPDQLAVNYALEIAGVEQLLFGSDHPWVTIDTILNFVKQMDCSEKDFEKILGLNARSLFRI